MKGGRGFPMKSPSPENLFSEIKTTLIFKVNPWPTKQQVAIQINEKSCINSLIQQTVPQNVSVLEPFW